MSGERRGVASSSGTGHDAALARYRLTVIFEAEDDGEAEIAVEKVTDKLASFNFPVIEAAAAPAEPPVAAPDHAETIRRALAYWSDTSIGSEEEREVHDAALAALDALLVERQQDKERIERLTEVGKAAQIVADVLGESRSTYGRVVTHVEFVNAMFRLETAVVAALSTGYAWYLPEPGAAVEEDAE